MKKIILAIAALALIASPAMAVDWNFYGSARIQTSYHWWEEGDLGVENVFTTAVPFSSQTGVDAPNFTFDDEDDGLYWDLLGTSRIGARVRGEGVNARFEFNNGVGTRLLWGQWAITPGLRLRVGQDWRPLNYFYSGQQHNDTGMAGPDGAGGVITHRDPQLKLIIGEGQNLHIAFVDGDAIAGSGLGDVDIWMPIIEANYHFAADTFFFDVGGAFWTYDVEDSPIADDDVMAYVIAAGGGMNFGPAYFKANAFYGQNLSELGWVSNRFPIDTLPTFDAGGNTDDVDSWGVLGVVGMRFTDQMAVEVGAGYECHDNGDLASLAPLGDDDETFAIYGHFNYTAAPGMHIIPEIGYIDLMDNFIGQDEGEKTYFSIKWQVDF